ncbi:rhodanese-like domain-containing protein [Flavobacterium sp.]|uniref:rhodanese-like domain-containing protein n=1 Tax=Flavobacterium sp. TaxID=239 RepID=UPI00262EAF8F|nr:rhodanese-like domain-containing protein [Flavobacterium sp.]MDG2431268.1 rhodanese-like domain-containing protein [Flavobacterium sp.]
MNSQPKLILLSIFFVCFSSLAQQSIKSKTIAPLEFAENISSTLGTQILDVRTPEEFNLGHIDNSLNIDWLGTTFVADTKKLDKKNPVYVYCKSGNRSSKAVKKLEELGFETIIELEGGYTQWQLTSFNKPNTPIIGMSLQEFNRLLESEKAVLINFSGNCTSCQKIESIISKLGKEQANRVQIITIDFEKNKTIAAKLEVDNLPALLLYKNKNLSWRQSGVVTEEELKKQLQ